MERTIKDINNSNYMEDWCYPIFESLVRAVIIRHFPRLTKEEREDSMQEGLLKVYTLMKSGTYDESRNNLTGYLYTGIRNSVGNMLRRGQKEVLQSEEEWFDVPAKQTVVTDLVCTRSVLERTILHKTLKGRYNLPLVVTRLRARGIRVDAEVPNEINIRHPGQGEKWLAQIMWDLKTKA